MSTKEGMISVAKAAQSTADMYFMYDANLDGELSSYEIDSHDPYNLELFLRFIQFGHDGVGRDEIQRLITDPKWSAMFFTGLNTFVKKWRLLGGKLERDRDDDRQLVTSLLPHLEKFSDEVVLKAISDSRDLLIALDALAKGEMASGELAEMEYSAYMRSITLYLKQKAAELPEKKFLELMERMQTEVRRCGDVATFCRELLKPEQVQRLYRRLKGMSVRKGEKALLVYDINSGDYKIMVRPKSFKIDVKKDPYRLLAINRGKGGKGKENIFEMFSGNLREYCGWLAPFGRLRMLQAVKEARAKIEEAGAESLVVGSGKAPLSHSISDAQALGIIYVEKRWSSIQKAKGSDEDIRNVFDGVDMVVALEGSKAYCNVKSPVGAQGIAQIMSIAYDDIAREYPTLIREDFMKIACDLDNSILAVFLLIDRKKQTISAMLRKDGFSVSDAIKGLSDSAIAIAYNHSAYSAKHFVQTGSTKDVPRKSAENGKTHYDIPENTVRYAESYKITVDLLSAGL